MTKLSAITAAIRNTIGVSVHHISVTPDQAKAWIENANTVGFVNRTPNLRAISKYANEMAGGNWHNTFDPIHLSVEKGLAFPINGQHRLLAIIKADVPIELLVVSGVDRTAFKYFDQGQARTLDQIMAIADKEVGGSKWSSPRDQATVARKLYKQDHTGSPVINLRPEDSVQDGVIFDYIEQKYAGTIESVFSSYGGLFTAISRGKKVVGVESKGFGPRSAWAFFTLRACDTFNEERLTDLLNFFADPSANRNANHIWRTLAKYIEAIRAGAEEGAVVKTRHLDFHEAIIAGLYVAWNAVATNAKFPKLSDNAVTRSGEFSLWYEKFDNLVSEQLLSKEWKLLA